MNRQQHNDKDLQEWIQRTLQDSVYKLVDLEVVSSKLVEAKPAWVFPYTILIGKVKNSEHGVDFSWFINAEGAISYAPQKVAKSPRQAANYFTLQWQLKAQQLRDGTSNDTEQAAASLSTKAESLFQLVQTDSLWLSS